MSEKELHLKQFHEEFQDALCTATQKIEEKYFKITMANSKRIFYRERVYCYELYHQLRVALESFPYSLQGEMDKNGHYINSRKKPDFILHRQGPMDAGNNLVAMEVKSLNNTSKKQLKKDLDTLSYFLKNAQYDSVVHLIYGSMKKNDGGISKVIEAYKEYEYQSDKQHEFRGKLLLYWHSKHGEPAEVYNWEKYLYSVTNLT